MAIRFARKIRLYFSGKNVIGAIDDGFAVRSHQMIGTAMRCFDPFGFIAHGDAWHAIKESLFLDATRIGEDEFRTLFERHHVQEWKWVGQDQPIKMAAVSIALDEFAGAWMEGKDDGKVRQMAESNLPAP